MKHEEALKKVDERQSAAGKEEHLGNGGFKVLAKLDPGASEINSKNIACLQLCSWRAIRSSIC